MTVIPNIERDYRPDLPDIVDPAALETICRHFARLHRVGIVVGSGQGEVVVDMVPDDMPCHHLGGGRRTPSVFARYLTRTAPRRGSTPVSFPCGCGLQGESVAVEHRGDVVARIVVGPYALHASRPGADDLLGACCDGGHLPDIGDIRSTAEAIGALDAMTPARVKQLTQTVAAVVLAMVRSGHARQVSSQIHLSALQHAYEELAERNRELAESVEKLKDLDKMKSAFLATVSHELRTPLTSIIGYGEMLLDGLAGPLNPEQHGFTQVIMDKGDQLLRIISEVLDLSRIESGKVKLMVERVDVAGLMNDALRAVRPRSREPQAHRFELDAPGDLPPILADPAKLKQAVVNLLANAVKFSPTGGRVGLSAREHRGPLPPEAAGCDALANEPRILIVVQDEGIGVPVEARPRIFDAFYQADSTSTREFGGTGLGLAIVKSFVRAHGGCVWLDADHDGLGAVFCILLPLRCDAATALQMPFNAQGG